MEAFTTLDTVNAMVTARPFKFGKLIEAESAEHKLMSLTNRPKVFVSSTVYDFEDLRSALRYWLEQMEYDVLFSEYSDFPQSSGTNSYPSCINAIDECQYFILFIGGRAGGMMPDGISITRAEYRRAYELMKAGKLILIPFVRRRVWDVREDRKALERYLLELAEVDEELRSRIAKHPSKLISDVDSITSFIDEVVRAKEMKAALKGTGDLPTGNWIYPFSSFREIIDALTVQMKAGKPLRKAALSAVLRQEILFNASRLYRKEGDGNYYPITILLAEVFAKYPDNPSVSSYSVSSRDFALLGRIITIVSSLSDIKCRALNEALLSGEFLQYDNEQHRFVDSPLQTALLQISHRQDHIALRDATILRVEFEEYAQKKQGDAVCVSLKDILRVWNYYGSVLDLLFLYKHTLDALNDDDVILNSTQYSLQMPPSLQHSATINPTSEWIEMLFKKPWKEIPK